MLDIHYMYVRTYVWVWVDNGDPPTRNPILDVTLLAPMALAVRQCRPLFGCRTGSHESCQKC